MVYTLREARKGSGKRDSILEWYKSGPSEETFENYRNSRFWVEQPKASWYSTMSLIRRNRLTHTSTRSRDKKPVPTKILPDTRSKDKVLHGKLTETWGAADYFQIEGFSVSYLKEKSGDSAVFEADFNYVDVDQLSKMLTHNSVGEVAHYLEDHSNMHAKITFDYPSGKDCGDLQYIIFTIHIYLENNTLTFSRL